MAALGLSWGIQDLVPWPGIDPRPPALEVWSLSHWKAPIICFHYIRAPFCSWGSHGKNTGAVCHSLLIGKDPDAGKDWRQKEKRMTDWDGWMASQIQWTQTWVNSRRQWGIGKPGVLQSMGSWRVGHDLATECQQQKQIFNCTFVHIFFTYSPVDGHLGCFHVLAIVNSATMNTGVHASFSITLKLIFKDTRDHSLYFQWQLNGGLSLNNSIVWK